MPRPTRATAIRQFCYDCNGTQAFNFSNDCVSRDCALYPFRPGRGLPGQAPKSNRGKKRNVEHNGEDC